VRRSLRRDVDAAKALVKLLGNPSGPELAHALGMRAFLSNAPANFRPRKHKRDTWEWLLRFEEPESYVRAWGDWGESLPFPGRFCRASSRNILRRRLSCRV
jgi:hypothetical protein